MLAACSTLAASLMGSARQIIRLVEENFDIVPISELLTVRKIPCALIKAAHTPLHSLSFTSYK